MRRSAWLAFGLGGLVAACVTTQHVQVQVTAAPASAQWQGAWGGSIGGGVTALPGGGLTFPAGQILAPDGTEAAPAYAFASDPDTGMFRNAANDVRLASNGTTGLALDAASIYIQRQLYFFPDNTRDIGTSGVMPRNLWLGGSITFGIPSVPGTPAAGFGVLYLKADKKLYFKNDAGVESALF